MDAHGVYVSAEVNLCRLFFSGPGRPVLRLPSRPGEESDIVVLRLQRAINQPSPAQPTHGFAPGERQRAHTCRVPTKRTGSPGCVHATRSIICFQLRLFCRRRSTNGKAPTATKQKKRRRRHVDTGRGQSVMKHVSTCCCCCCFCEFVPSALPVVDPQLHVSRPQGPVCCWWGLSITQTKWHLAPIFGHN